MCASASSVRDGEKVLLCLADGGVVSHDDEARDRSAVCLFAGEGVRVARTEVHDWNTKYTYNVM